MTPFLLQAEGAALIGAGIAAAGVIIWQALENRDLKRALLEAIDRADVAERHVTRLARTLGQQNETLRAQLAKFGPKQRNAKGHFISTKREAA